jgi:hypothetical protein
MLVAPLFLGFRVCFADVPTTAHSETEWSKLQVLLRDCTSVTTNPSPLAESTMLPEAPLLGNGEVGVAVSGNQKRLTLFVDHACFRRYALGGVDIIAEGNPGPAPLAARHEQDIQRAELRSHVTLNGFPVEATSWLATDQPLVFCQIRNPSDQPLSLRVSTWTRPPLGNLRVNPFRLTPGTGRDAEYGLNDGQGRVTYGPPPANGAELWTLEERDGATHLRNLGTGRYLAVVPGGQLTTYPEPCATTACTNKSERWGVHFRYTKTDKYLGLAGPYTLKSRAEMWVPSIFDKPRNLRIQFAAHWFLPDTAGLIGDTCWSWRNYAESGYTVNAAIVTRVLSTATAKDASFTVVLPAHGSVTVAFAVIGDCNDPQKVKSLEQCRREGQAVVRDLTTASVQSLSDRRLTEWQDFWLKAWLDTGDGGWREGPGYWSYAASNGVIPGMTVIKNALGTTFGLDAMPGFKDVAYFAHYVTAPAGHRVFVFGDSGEVWNFNSLQYWFATFLDMADVRGMLVDDCGGDYLGIVQKCDVLPIPYRPDLFARKASSSQFMPLGRCFCRIEMGSLRSAWNNPDAWHVAFKGGYPADAHSNIHSGTFVIDALGQRWITSGSGDSYTAEDAWNYTPPGWPLANVRHPRRVEELPGRQHQLPGRGR